MTLLAALRRIGSHLRAGHRIGCETCAYMDGWLDSGESPRRIQVPGAPDTHPPESAAAQVPSPTGRLAAGSPSDYPAIWHVKGCRQDCPGHPFGYEPRPDPAQAVRTGG